MQRGHPGSSFNVGGKKQDLHSSVAISASRRVSVASSAINVSKSRHASQTTVNQGSVEQSSASSASEASEDTKLKQAEERDKALRRRSSVYTNAFKKRGTLLQRNMGLIKAQSTIVGAFKRLETHETNRLGSSPGSLGKFKPR